MMTDFIPQMRPFFGLEEKNAICQYLQEDGFITEYKRTETFENMIAQYTGARNCIVTNNGTISLTLAALATGISSGDEVLVPNYTMIATPNSVEIFGAKPVFVDVEKETLCIDLHAAERHLTQRTKAIVVVSANGRYPKLPIQKYVEFARKHELILIEDAAQSLGSYYPNGKHIGTVGKVGTLSFSTPKIISTGQGGAILTDDDEIADKIRRLKDFGRASGGIDLHDSIGYNFKFTELQACLGIEQMKKLPARVKRKKEIWKRYYDNLANVDGITLFEHELIHTSPWFVDTRACQRASLIRFLKDKQIGSRVMYPPINAQRAYGLPGSYPVSENIGECGLWLPSFVQISDSIIDYVCQMISSFYNNL
jgi:perosamine synthetase